jgi:hypothetical protein
MTPTETALIIGACGTFLTAVTSAVAMVLTLIGRRDIKELALNTNSIKDALVASTAKASHAEGVAEGKASR